MKKLLLVLPIAFLFSCGDAEQSSTTDVQTSNNTENHEGHDHSGHDHTHATPEGIVDYKTHDPVCKMERDEKWTITSMHQNDTVKFCSPVCKDKFDKEPAKYLAATN